MHRTLSTDHDVRAEITDALGEHADDHDLDQIAAECFEYSPDTQRFEQTVDTAGFWAAVERAAR